MDAVAHTLQGAEAFTSACWLFWVRLPVSMPACLYRSDHLTGLLGPVLLGTCGYAPMHCLVHGVGMCAVCCVSCCGGCHPSLVMQAAPVNCLLHGRAFFSSGVRMHKGRAFSMSLVLVLVCKGADAGAGCFQAMCSLCMSHHLVVASLCLDFDVYWMPRPRSRRCPVKKVEAYQRAHYLLPPLPVAQMTKIGDDMDIVNMSLSSLEDNVLGILRALIVLHKAGLAYRDLRWPNVVSLQPPGGGAVRPLLIDYELVAKANQVDAISFLSWPSLPG